MVLTALTVQSHTMWDKICSFVHQKGDWKMSKANSLFIRASLVSLGKYLNAILILFKYYWVWETLEN